MSHDAETTARRTVLNALGVAALGGVALSAPAQAAKKKSTAFVPARHPEDAWMDALPWVPHRVFIDTDSASGGRQRACAMPPTFLNGAGQWLQGH